VKLNLGKVRSGGRLGARARRGLTLLEIAVAVAVLAIGLGSSVYALLAGMALQRTAAEHTLALQAAETALESIQAVDFAEAFARFNATVADDPGLGLSPGDDFEVPGLTPQPGDADGRAGEFLFPGDNVGLAENVADAELGMPRDLDMDGDLGGADEYAVLPVRVRVRWRGALGDRELVLGTILNNERKEALP
jgi:prepilin-type N-terminal cleavage/methylation domain-containing protein